MGYLEKNFILHERDSEGKLIPLDKYSKKLGGKLLIQPITRGDVLKHFGLIKQIDMKNEPDKIGEIRTNFILEHIIEPKFTKEELSDAKLMTIEEEGEKKQTDLLTILEDDIYEASGINIVVDKKEDELKKN